MNISLPFTTSPSKAKRGRVERAPRFLRAHTYIVVIVATLAAISSAGAALTVLSLGLPAWVGLPAAGAAALAAAAIGLLTIELANAWATAEDTNKLVGLCLTAAIMLADGALQYNAVHQIEHRTRAAEITRAQGALDAVQTRLLTLDDISEGWRNREARAQVALTKARTSRLDRGRVILALSGLGIGLFFLRGWLTFTTKARNELLVAQRRRPAKAKPAAAPKPIPAFDVIDHVNLRRRGQTELALV